VEDFGHRSALAKSKTDVESEIPNQKGVIQQRTSSRDPHKYRMKEKTLGNNFYSVNTQPKTDHTENERKI
jgi:hypothetical protein